MIVKAGIPCLTVRQPWAWSIFNLGKDVENRSWRMIHHTGPLAIHVSKRWVMREQSDDEMCIDGILGRDAGIVYNDLQTQLGCIIGIVDLVDCIRGSSSPWAVDGQWHWILKNPRLVRPVRCKGTRGLFPSPEPLEVIASPKSSGGKL